MCTTAARTTCQLAQAQQLLRHQRDATRHRIHTLLRRQHSHQGSSFSRHAAVCIAKLPKLGLIIAVAATATSRQHDQHESHVGNCGFLEANRFCHYVFNV
jgi:hypothetical protein